MAVAIEAEGLVKTYGETRALDGLDLAVESGTILGVLGWLQPIANWNPISAVAAACRDLFGNPNPSATIQAWPMQHPIEASIAWSVLLIAVFAPLAVRLYQRRAAA